MIIIIITTMRMITKNGNDCKNDDYNNGFHNYDLLWTIHSFIQLPLFNLSYTHFFFPLDVKLRAAKSKPTCSFNRSKYLRRTKHYKHHWKQSGLYGSIQKPKHAINHKSVYHCLSSQRSALCNNRNAFSIYNANHWKMGFWRRSMPNARFYWRVFYLRNPCNPWFDCN